jgi:hypothetical protein
MPAPVIPIEPMSDDWYIQQAVEQYGSDDVEFDDAVQPEISRGEGGAWVSAWVWVANPDEDEEDDAEQDFLQRKSARYDHEQNYLEGE